MVSDEKRLAELEARLKALKATQIDDTPHVGEHYTAAQLGWRMVLELVVGLMIGFGMGYGLDVLFGTMPIFLVLLTLAGLAAGIKTMLRTAEEVRRSQEAGGSGETGKGPENGG